MKVKTTRRGEKYSQRTTMRTMGGGTTAELAGWIPSEGFEWHCSFSGFCFFSRSFSPSFPLGPTPFIRSPFPPKAQAPSPPAPAWTKPPWQRRFVHLGSITFSGLLGWAVKPQTLNKPTLMLLTHSFPQRYGCTVAAGSSAPPSSPSKRQAPLFFQWPLQLREATPAT